LSAALCGHSSTDAVRHLSPFDAEPPAYTIRGGDYAKSSIRAPLAARSRITSGRLSRCREIASRFAQQHPALAAIIQPQAIASRSPAFPSSAGQ
jgi:hypothetical protein